MNVPEICCTAVPLALVGHLLRMRKMVNRKQNTYVHVRSWLLLKYLKEKQHATA